MTKQLAPYEARIAKAKALVGKRIEIPVHYDMWMKRGARTGKVTRKCSTGDYVKVDLDHPRTKRMKQLTLWAIDYDYVKVLA